MTPEQRRAYQAESISLLYAAINREVSKKDLFEAMLEMEEKYPGLGWKQKAHEMML